MYEKAFEILKQNDPPLHKEARRRIFRILIDAAQENPRSDSQFKKRHLREIQHVVSDLLESEEYQTTTKEFIIRFTDRESKICFFTHLRLNSYPNLKAA